MMEANLSPKQSLFLWRLMVEPDGMFVSKLKPSLSTAERKQLVDLGLIKIEKRKQGSETRATGFASLTEQGWQWAETNLDAPFPKAGAVALTILQKLLQALKAKVESSQVSLAELLSAGPTGRKPMMPSPRHDDSNRQPAPTMSDTTSDATVTNSGGQQVAAPHAAIDTISDDVKRRLYRACLQLSGDGVYGTRIRLADLRSELADVPRQEVDRALLELEQTDAASLMPIDDPQQILPDDEEAALSSSNGMDRHVLFLSDPR